MHLHALRFEEKFWKIIGNRAARRKPGGALFGPVMNPITYGKKQSECPQNQSLAPATLFLAKCRNPFHRTRGQKVSKRPL